MRDGLNPSGMYSKVELIDPDRAQQLLESQINPRSAVRDRISRYCEARKSGDWVLHHQGIAINCEGRMVDGQHRMRMVVETGMPTAFYVTYNVPDEATLHIDEQMPRSIRVALRAAGRGEFTNSVISVARVIETLPEHTMTSFSRDVMLALLKLHAPALDFAETHARRANLFTASSRCVVAQAYYSADVDRLCEWCEVVSTGVPVSKDAKEDTAAIRFRNLLFDLRGSGGAAREVERFRKGQSALLAFLQRQPMTKVYGTDKQIFPLPHRVTDPGKNGAA